MHHQSVASLGQSLRSGQFSSVELTQHCLNRIEQLNPDLNCFITLTAQLALEQAQAADRRLAQGNSQPLTGNPIRT